MSKVAVITGGTKGIGRALVDTFFNAGFQVFTCARTKDDLNKLALHFNSSGGIQVQPFLADLSKKNEAEAFIEFVRNGTNHVDVLINNTGRFIAGNVLDEDESTLPEMINTNLYSAYWLTRGLLEQLSKKLGASIFNICSVASLYAYPAGGSYSISKHAMYGLSRVLREELKPKGIRVIAVLPGAVFTSSWEGTDKPMDEFILPEDIAKIILSTHELSPSTNVDDLVIKPTK